ncbi:MAG: ribosome silencing factor [Bacteroidota bacterium]
MAKTVKKETEKKSKVVKKPSAVIDKKTKVVKKTSAAIEKKTKVVKKPSVVAEKKTNVVKKTSAASEKKTKVVKKSGTVTDKKTEVLKKLRTVKPKAGTPKKKKPEERDVLTNLVVKALLDKKGNDIVTMNMKPLPSSVCDCFVICHGNSKTQVDALAESVIATVKKEMGVFTTHKEGFENSEWILLDYFDVVVHIFQEEFRGFYQLEKLWADAEMKHISESESN